MLTTATTHIQFPTREDGGLRDPDPGRRAARLRAAGVSVERCRPFEHVVHRDGEFLARRRTSSGAERTAHAAASDRLAA